VFIPPSPPRLLFQDNARNRTPADGHQTCEYVKTYPQNPIDMLLLGIRLPSWPKPGWSRWLCSPYRPWRSALARYIGGRPKPGALHGPARAAQRHPTLPS
jgi:hypothetical protein